jgi:hypothetical protein
MAAEVEPGGIALAEGTGEVAGWVEIIRVFFSTPLP